MEDSDGKVWGKVLMGACAFNFSCFTEGSLCGGEWKPELSVTNNGPVDLLLPMQLLVVFEARETMRSIQRWGLGGGGGGGGVDGKETTETKTQHYIIFLREKNVQRNNGHKALASETSVHHPTPSNN